MLALSATANYTMRRESAGVNYFHGTTGGSGFMLGEKFDSVSANFSREFGRNLTVGSTGSYMRTSSLIAYNIPESCPNGATPPCYAQIGYTPDTRSFYGGVQATRKLGRYMNVFANYTLIDQSSNLQVQISTPILQLTGNANILNGMYQVIGFGIGYSPREKRFKR
jgi:hypothetical protein